MINNRLRWFLEKPRKIPLYQTGFRKSCTTVDNLVRLESDIKAAFNDNKSLTALFLDISKAYDTAWINDISYKLADMGVQGPTLRWIHNYLNDRSMIVKLDGTLSAVRTLSKGGVLSPLV